MFLGFLQKRPGRVFDDTLLWLLALHDIAQKLRAKHLGWQTTEQFLQSISLLPLQKQIQGTRSLQTTAKHLGISTEFQKDCICFFHLHWPFCDIYIDPASELSAVKAFTSFLQDSFNTSAHYFHLDTFPHFLFRFSLIVFFLQFRFCKFLLQTLLQLYPAVEKLDDYRPETSPRSSVLLHYASLRILIGLLQPTFWPRILVDSFQCFSLCLCSGARTQPLFCSMCVERWEY